MPKIVQARVTSPDRSSERLYRVLDGHKLRYAQREGCAVLEIETSRDADAPGGPLLYVVPLSQCNVYEERTSDEQPERAPRANTGAPKAR